jgi:hypothetical protein
LTTHPAFGLCDATTAFHHQSQCSQLEAFLLPRQIANICVQKIGVKTFDVSLEKQTAEVITADDSLTYDKVLATIAKTGKKVKAGYADGEAKSIEVPPVAI